MHGKTRYLTSLLASVLILAGSNAIELLRTPSCCDFIYSYEFPMPFFITGGFGGIRQFSWFGAFVDLIAVALIACFLSWAWKRFSEHKSMVSTQK